MAEVGTDYLSLVREEFVARGVKHGGQVSFVKVKKEINRDNFDKEFVDNIIPDDNLPFTDKENLVLNGETAWLPISAQKYPGICKSMTANQAGYFAIRKCKQQGWDFLEDWQCVLSNLEMDL
jgi:hypothetical protein